MLINYLIAGFIFIVCAVGVAICADTNRFVVRDYVIYSDKIQKEMKIALLADLHNKEFGRENYKLIKAIRDIDPDIICCAGDMITAAGGQTAENALNLFNYLRDYPVYYGIGNHEYRLKLYPDKHPIVYEEYLDALREMGVHVLENGFIDIEGTGISIGGIMIGREFYRRKKGVNMSPEDVYKLIGKRTGDGYSILLAHDPDHFESYAASGVDLVFSGHVHGGIMRLPVLGGVISPKLELFPHYDGGLYTCGSTQMVLSRGLGYHTLPIRLFNPGELISIKLSPCKVER